MTHRDALVTKANKLARDIKEWSDSVTDNSQLPRIRKISETVEEFITEYYTRMREVVPFIAKNLSEEDLIPAFSHLQMAERSRFLADYLKDIAKVLSLLSDKNMPTRPEERTVFLKFALKTVHISGITYANSRGDKAEDAMKGVQVIEEIIRRYFMSLEANNMPTDGSAPPVSCARNSTICDGITNVNDVVGFFKSGGVVSS